MENEILENLGQSVLTFDQKGAAKWAEKAVAEQIDPLKAMDALVTAIKEVGDAFGRGDVFLPELIGAAGSLLQATPIIEAEIRKRGTERKSQGKVVIGSVAGAIHNIGKSMVSSLLTAAGFTVQDLGIDVSTEKFVNSVKELQPDILAMSALLTTTAPEARKVIEALEQAGIRDKVKVMIGGGAITSEFAEAIGAEGYDSTAPGAVKVASTLLGR
jgi:methanogenic corrinoid protein MtbC1